jgi:hypothetical protein
MKRAVILSASLLIALVVSPSSAGPRRAETEIPVVYDGTAQRIQNGGVFGVSQVSADTFFYGGTVWDAANEWWEAAAPSAAGWANRKMWTWSAGGFDGTPHSGQNMDGWLGVDSTACLVDKFGVKSSAEIGFRVISGDRSLFCGLDSVECVEWGFGDPFGTGYGHNWVQNVVTRSYSYQPGDNITLAYNYYNETEAFYDSTYVILQVLYPGTSQWIDWAILTEYTGTSESNCGVAVCAESGDQFYPQITSDGEGGAIITWENHGLAESDIHAQRVDNLGGWLWTAGGVPVCAAFGDQSSAQLASDGTGGAIITWEDYRSGNPDIYAQRVDATGSVLWAYGGISICGTTGDEEAPQVVPDGAGGAIIAWRTADGGDSDLWLQRVDPSGDMLWPAPGVAVCTTSGDWRDARLEADGTGGAIITWEDYRGDNSDIYAQRVDGSGAVLWTPGGEAICTASGFQYSPAIVSDGAGGAIIAWENGVTGNYDIYAQRVDGSGETLWTAEGVPICVVTGMQQFPELVSDGASGAIITWQDQRPMASVYAQRVDSEGTPLWTANGVAVCGNTSQQGRPAIVSDGAGGAIITWDAYPPTRQVYAQRVDASGALLWTANGIPMCAGATENVGPQIASDDAGGAIIAWFDARSGTANPYDIYAARADSSGDAPWPTERFDIGSYVAANVDFRISFLFRSDGVWDDEDGMYGTNSGACIFDDYALFGDVTDSEDFEDVAVGSVPFGWQVIGPVAACGDFARAEHIDDLPIGLDEDPCVLAFPGSCGIADSVIILSDPLHPEDPHPDCQRNYVMSPVIDLSDHPDLPGKVFSFERFADLPLSEGVFMMWMVRYRPYPGPPEWSPWASDGYAYYTYSPDCARRSFDVSNYVAPTTEQVQVALCVVNLCGFYPGSCGVPNSVTPYFDNVTFGVFECGDAPLVSIQECDYWQDQFAQDGTLDPTSTADTRTARNSCAAESPPVADFGDWLVCIGYDDDMEVYLVFRLAKVGPGQDVESHDFFESWFPTVTTGAWQEARMDTLQSGGLPALGSWMSTFHELDPRFPGSQGVEILPDDLFVPGTRVEYFLKAKYTGSMDYYLLPDTTGGVCEEFEVLPMMRDDSGGGVEWPSLIVVDHFGQRGNGGERNSDRIGRHLATHGVAFDTYSKLAPASLQGNGIGRTDPYEGRSHPGATLDQLLGYEHCILNTGSIYGGCVEEQDVALLTNWLMDTTNVELSRFLWLSGDWACSEIASTPWGLAFLDTVMCADLYDDSYSDDFSDYTYCLPVAGLGGGRIECGETESYVVRENGCDRKLDVIVLSGSTSCSAVAEVEYDSQSPSAVAAISNVFSAGNVNYKTLVEGYDFCLARNSGSQGPPECASDDFVASWLACVLNWAADANIGVTDPGIPPARVTSLSQSFPNPMNPTASINFSIGTRGKVMLRIFDVSGRVMRTLVDEVKAVGRYSVIWDGKNDHGKQVGSGVFFYQLEAPGFTSAKKIVILK